MRTLNLSGFKAADSLSISVSQNALTAGPITIPAWGGGGSGGTITINVHRNALHVAPSSVRFSVDLSLSNFDTPGPGEGEVYDPRLHELIYLWDFDDPGTWTAPVQNLAAHKNRNAGKGPIEANMYRTPGTYNPSVLVIEPSTGKTATASVSVTVTDPDVVFAGTKTICINPVGDSDFAGAPAGSVQLQVDLLVSGHTAWANQMSETEVKRWLFKGGETHLLNLYLGQYKEAGAYFGSYGTGRAILRSERRTTITDVLYDNHPFTSRWANKKDSPYWFVDLEAAGNFDATAGLPNNPSGYDHTFLRYKDTGYITMSNCHIHHYMGTTITLGAPASSNIPGYASGIQVMHMDDCVIDNCGGNQYVTYQAWAAAYEGTWWVASGTRINLHPDTWDGDLIRGTMRINDSMRQIVKGCDIFNTEYDQPALKLVETALEQGAIANCHSNAIEGQLAVIYVNGNSSQTETGGTMVTNVVIDGNILCGGHSTQTIFIFYATGITVRNNLCYVPGGPYNKQKIGGMVAVKDTRDVGNDPGVYAYPIKIYNNTFRCDRSAADNANKIPQILLTDEYSQVDPPIYAENNVLHSPSAVPPLTAFAPVSDTVLFTPRSTGWVNARGSSVTPVEPLGTPHPEFAPTTSVKDTKPLPGSAALGAALSGNVSYMDILGTTRTAPADKGAWVA